ncbi:hypothetical protein MLD38_024926 [Melastoma candidum]|uniref:Uncharacterized protein n=1 Tax=Melastoma candidum TaxID=119954 RepID=A0ACB9NWN2_9MYRT|nr:hypothetical protein MLD38_024926 [Melastoma candidum]
MPQGSEDWEKQMALAKLFEKRPIWPKRSLNDKLLAMGFNLGSLMPKRSCRLLVNVAYYFNNGPFLKFWIRKGYDPRKDPESRMYQGIDFRVPQQLQSYCESAETSKSDCRWEDICAFRIFPQKCHLSLQLFELTDDYIQEEIKNSPLQQSCTFKNGWFVDHVLDRIRQRAMMRFLSVFPQPGAEGLLKQASERFEKLKRVQLRHTPLRQQKFQQDTEDTQEEEEEEEEEDIESDNDIEGAEAADDGEEEIDADDVFDQEADAGDPLELNSYTGADSISRTYLQELFGSFPGTKGVGQELDMKNLEEEVEGDEEEGEDGEYEIYEQDSDGSYSDED